MLFFYISTDSYCVRKYYTYVSKSRVAFYLLYLSLIVHRKEKEKTGDNMGNAYILIYYQYRSLICNTNKMVQSLGKVTIK